MSTSGSDTPIRAYTEEPATPEIIKEGDAETRGDAEADPAQYLLDQVHEARRCHERSKAAAGFAVGHVHVLWSSTEADGARSQPRDWLNKAIAVENTKIETHNTEVDYQRLRTEQFKNGKLPSSDIAIREATNARDRKEREEERAKLTADAALTKEHWGNRRKLPIEAREGASKFTRIVKFALQFDLAMHSEQISRYCKVLEWVENQPELRSVRSADAIGRAIQAAGGFEAVLHAQRDRGGAAGKTTSTKNAIFEGSKSKAVTLLASVGKLTDGVLQLIVVHKDQALTAVAVRVPSEKEVASYKTEFPLIDAVLSLKKGNGKKGEEPENQQQGSTEEGAQ